MTHFVEGVGVLWLAQRYSHRVCLADQWGASAASPSDQWLSSAATQRGSIVNVVTVHIAVAEAVDLTKDDSQPNLLLQWKIAKVFGKFVKLFGPLPNWLSSILFVTNYKYSLTLLFSKKQVESYNFLSFSEAWKITHIISKTIKTETRFWKLVL
jgi:hypothetical protein